MKTSKINSFLKKNPGIFKRVQDIEVPDILFRPLKTDCPEIDKAFSEMGGITPSCMVLMTGTPGSGKTTLAASIASRLKDPRPAVFMSFEMSDFQLKLCAKKIPGFDEMLIVTNEYHKESKEAFLEFLNGPLRDIDPSMVIVDSLQKMAGVMGGSVNNNQCWITDKLTAWAKSSYVPVLMIGHCTKGGDYKGPTTIKHEVDAHLHLSIDKELQERVFSFSKNRFGGCSDQTVFRINGQGIFIGNEYWEGADGETDTDELGIRVKETIANFKLACKGKDHIPTQTMRTMGTELLKYLSEKYRPELLVNGVAKKADLKITYKGKRAYCAPGSAKINLGDGFFKKINNETWKQVGYSAEKPIIRKHCNNKADLAVWVVIHEFCHLFKGRQKHVKSFYNFVARTWTENKAILA